MMVWANIYLDMCWEMAWRATYAGAELFHLFAGIKDD